MMPACCRKSCSALVETLSKSLRRLSGRQTRIMILYLPFIAGTPASLTIAKHSFSQPIYSADRNILPFPIRQRRLIDGGLGKEISTAFFVRPLQIGMKQCILMSPIGQ